MALGPYAITLPSISLTVVPKLTLLFAAATDTFDLSDRSGDPPSPPSKTARMFWVMGACHNGDFQKKKERKREGQKPNPAPDVKLRIPPGLNREGGRKLVPVRRRRYIPGRIYRACRGPHVGI